MPHLDPDRLVLLALGEQPPSAGENEHLAGCNACRTDLAATHETAVIGRETEHVRDLPEPSEELWDRIAAEAFPPAVRPRKKQRWRIAVAAVVFLAIAAAVGVQQLLSPARDEVVAVADLLPSAAAPKGAHGTATIVETGRGLQLRIAVTGMPATTGYYTVWLYDGRTVMVPIGSPGAGPLNVPAAAGDINEFRIVDVSAQRLGEQEHGTSMLQGVLHK